jgi:FSR family fosmidomycin resistance protein-like MFS transporter
MTDHEQSTNIRVILGLTLIHFIGDFYVSFVNPLLPVFVDKLGLSLVQVGLLAGISRFMASVVQPPVGYFADRYRTRFFVLGGPLLPILFIPLTGIAPSYLLLIVMVAVGSIGSSMLHPTTAGMVSTYAGRHLGFAMSIFNAGGTFAFALGPLCITYLVAAYGLEVAPVTMALGLGVMVLLFKLVPLPEPEGLSHLGFMGSLREVLGDVWNYILIIWLIMLLRAAVSQSFLVFLPVMYAREGYSLVSIGLIVSLWTTAGVLSGLLAGHLSDRMGAKPVFYVTHTLAGPALFVLLVLPGHWVYLGSFLAGFFVMATLPVGVAFAQQLAPKGRSMVSSLMMGLAFGTGGMLTPVVGKLGDMFSIRLVLEYLPAVPLVTAGLVFFLPAIKGTYRKPPP